MMLHEDEDEPCRSQMKGVGEGVRWQQVEKMQGIGDESVAADGHRCTKM